MTTLHSQVDDAAMLQESQTWSALKRRVDECASFMETQGFTDFRDLMSFRDTSSTSSQLTVQQHTNNLFDATPVSTPADTPASLATTAPSHIPPESTSSNAHNTRTTKPAAKPPGITLSNPCCSPDNSKIFKASKAPNPKPPKLALTSSPQQHPRAAAKPQTTNPMRTSAPSPRSKIPAAAATAAAAKKPSHGQSSSSQSAAAAAAAQVTHRSSTIRKSSPSAAAASAATSSAAASQSTRSSTIRKSFPPAPPQRSTSTTTRTTKSAAPSPRAPPPPAAPPAAAAASSSSLSFSNPLAFESLVTDAYQCEQQLLLLQQQLQAARREAHDWRCAAVQLQEELAAVTAKGESDTAKYMEAMSVLTEVMAGDQEALAQQQREQQRRQEEVAALREENGALRARLAALEEQQQQQQQQQAAAASDTTAAAASEASSSSSSSSGGTSGDRVRQLVADAAKLRKDYKQCKEELARERAGQQLQQQQQQQQQG